MKPHTYERMAFWYMTAYVAAAALIFACMLAGCATAPPQAPEQDFAFDEDFLSQPDEARPWGAYEAVPPFYHVMSGKLTATDGQRWYLLVTKEVCGEESWTTSDDKHTYFRTMGTCTNQTVRPVFEAKRGREDQ